MFLSFCIPISCSLIQRYVQWISCSSTVSDKSVLFISNIVATMQYIFLITMSQFTLKISWCRSVLDTEEINDTCLVLTLSALGNLFFQDENTLTLFRWQHCYLFIWQLQDLHDECSLEKNILIYSLKKNSHSTRVHTDQKLTCIHLSIAHCVIVILVLQKCSYQFVCSCVSQINMLSTLSHDSVCYFSSNNMFITVLVNFL